MPVSIKKTHDNGESFTAAIQVTADACRSSFSVQDSPGTIFTFYIKTDDTLLYFKKTYDHGQSFSVESSIVVDGDVHEKFYQISSVIITNGVIWVFTLMVNGTYRIYMSYDKGGTWSYKSVT